MPRKLAGLYAITQEGETKTLLKQCRDALAGGCRLLQYRDKTASPADQLSRAMLIKELCDEYDCSLFINDKVELAARVNAHGVHLGQTDMPLKEARQRLGPDAIIGVTCHGDIQLALAAQEAGADYIAFGRFFSSSTKPQAAHASLTVLTHTQHSLHKPIVAIGGINLDNAQQIVSAGAHMVAVCGALFNQRYIEQTARQFSRLFEAQTKNRITP